jgi:hypothetical protein
VDHPLDDEGMGPKIEVDLEELETVFSGGGVMLRHGGAKYNFFCMSQNEINSGPSSIT